MIDRLLKLLNWLSYGEWPLDMSKGQLIVRLLAWLARLITLFALLLALFVVIKLGLAQVLTLLLSTIGVTIGKF